MLKFCGTCSRKVLSSVVCASHTLIHSLSGKHSLTSIISVGKAGVQGSLTSVRVQNMFMSNVVTCLYVAHTRALLRFYERKRCKAVKMFYSLFIVIKRNCSCFSPRFKSSKVIS